MLFCKVNQLSVFRDAQAELSNIARLETPYPIVQLQRRLQLFVRVRRLREESQENALLDKTDK